MSELENMLGGAHSLDDILQASKLVYQYYPDLQTALASACFADGSIDALTLDRQKARNLVPMDLG